MKTYEEGFPRRNGEKVDDSELHKLRSLFIDAVDESISESGEDKKSHKDKVVKKVKQFLRQPLNVFISLTCIIISTYFVLLIIKEIKPESYSSKYLHCLELGSDRRANACIEEISGDDRGLYD